MIFYRVAMQTGSLWRTLAACRIDFRVDVRRKLASSSGNVDTNVDAARCKRAPRYSYFSARTGSMRDARRLGISAAINATTARIPADAASTIGSDGAIPKSCV
jgi:hypothetical protein